MEENQAGEPRDHDAELTEAAMSDPADVTNQESDPHPTFWRVVVLVLVAVAALSVVFGFAR